LYQIIINQFGLSLGEIETINHLFKGYHACENTVEPNFEYASILEIEFIKDISRDFFQFIPIEKWSFLLDIVKNIKKRRGKKGLYFKTTIVNTGAEKRGTGTGTQVAEEACNKNEKTFLKQITFTLNQKNDYDFIKGLERIEITIENLDEVYSQHQKKINRETNLQSKKENKDSEGKQNKKNKNNHHHYLEGENATSKRQENIRFLFDETRRKWIIVDHE
jgi:hypothetical protein